MNERTKMAVTTTFPYHVRTLSTTIFKSNQVFYFYVLIKTQNNEVLYSADSIYKVYAYCFLHLIHYEDVDFQNLVQQ